MAHVDDGQLNALLDGELSPDEARTVEAHVATCAECAARLAEARSFLTEAGELLAVLTPPARAAEPVKADVVAGRIAKTSKEVAVSVDGRTEMTPAIRPVFKHEVPAVPKRAWKLPSVEKMAWAASLILAVGVGYLWNEVVSLRGVQTTADNGRQRQTEVAANSPAAPAAVATTPPAAARREITMGAAEPATRQADARGAGRPNEERAPNVGPARPKPETSKPAPTFAQPRPEQIASTTQPTAGVPSGSALGDLGRAAAPAPAPALAAAPPAAGAGQRATADLRDRSSLDEASVTAPADFAARNATSTSFRRSTMDEAVRHLSGSIRLIDGMNPARVEVGPGRLVPGADPDREVVRVTYTSGINRLVLDQQLGNANAAGSFNGLMQGDTLVTALGSNGTQVRWVDRKFWLSITGGMSSDSLRAIVERIR